MKTSIACIALLVLGVAHSAPKDNEHLRTSLQDADLIFTGKIQKATVEVRAKTKPQIIFGTITFTGVKALRGKVTQDATFGYSYQETVTKDLDLRLSGKVLVAVSKGGVTALVPATQANLTLARKKGPKQK